jgi:CheY-like chemotaxis protein
LKLRLSKRFKVLVVDDDEVVGTITEETVRRIWSLEKGGMDVRVWRVNSGQTALNCLRLMESDPPDLILSDVRMPGMDGWGLLHAVKQDERLRHIPVIMVTSEPTEGVRVLAEHGGAAGYVKKPVVLRELSAAIEAARTTVQSAA